MNKSQRKKRTYFLIVVGESQAGSSKAAGDPGAALGCPDPYAALQALDQAVFHASAPALQRQPFPLL